MNHYRLTMIVRREVQPGECGLLIRLTIMAPDELTARRAAMELAWSDGLVVLAFGKIQILPLTRRSK